MDDHDDYEGLDNGDSRLHTYLTAVTSHPLLSTNQHDGLQLLRLFSLENG